MAFGLVGRSIFIRYLEDRGLLTPIQVADWTQGQAQNYETALNAKVATYQLFKALNERFNGDMFPPNPIEEASIEDRHLEGLRLFLAGYDFQSGQTSFWPYDFKFVPKELISGIYETVLESRRQSGTYYTPLPLADFVIGETLPLAQARPTMTMLDPACGSGVFLVKAYQRLIESWVEQNKKQLDVADLTALLQKSIFGVDIEPRAVQIAAFSLYLALLDNLSNEQLNGAHFRFPPLKDHNLFVGDFFADNTRQWLGDRRFDRVIGNPPWGRGTLTPQAAKRAREAGFDVGGEQLVQAFLAVAPQYIRASANAQLIQLHHLFLTFGF